MKKENKKIVRNKKPIKKARRNITPCIEDLDIGKITPFEMLQFKFREMPLHSVNVFLCKKGRDIDRQPIRNLLSKAKFELDVATKDFMDAVSDYHTKRQSQKEEWNYESLMEVTESTFLHKITNWMEWVEIDETSRQRMDKFTCKQHPTPEECDPERYSWVNDNCNAPKDPQVIMEAMILRIRNLAIKMVNKKDIEELPHMARWMNKTINSDDQVNISPETSENQMKNTVHILEHLIRCSINNIDNTVKRCFCESCMELKEITKQRKILFSSVIEANAKLRIESRKRITNQDIYPLLEMDPIPNCLIQTAHDEL